MSGIINKEQTVEKMSAEIGYSGQKKVEQFNFF